MNQQKGSRLNPIRVSGISSGGRARYLAELASSSSETLLVLCSDSTLARTLRHDFDSLDRALFAGALRSAFFPQWEASFRKKVAPSIAVRHERMGALAALRSANPPKVVFTTPWAILSATLPPEEFSLRETDLTQNDPDRLRSLLVLAGYQRVDTVEDPGTFAVRGDIVDLFPPHSARPTRIEYFGDQIERARDFDPETQKTDPQPTQLDLKKVPPARETLIHEESAPKIRALIKKTSDDLGIDRRLRDPVLSAIAPGFYPDHSDSWCAWAYDRPGSFFDYGAFRTVVIDSDATQSALQSLLEKERSLEQLALKDSEGFLFCPPLDTALRTKEWGIDPDQGIFPHDLAIEPFELLDSSSPQQKTLLEDPRPPTPMKDSTFTGVAEWLRDLVQKGFRIHLFFALESQRDRLRILLSQYGLFTEKSSQLTFHEDSLMHGYLWPEKGECSLPAEVLLGQPRTRATGKKSAAKKWSGLQELIALQENDLIVHRDHGIGRYTGMKRIGVKGAEADYLQLTYAQGDLLYLPVYRLNVIQKYSGASDAAVLDKLGSPGFAKAREKAKESAKKLAVDLVELYAKRSLVEGTRLRGPGPDLSEFENAFPYDETSDQLRAVEEILEDLTSGKVMDRLICGDVGYGKTEVAMRAAFRAVSDGYQVAVLVPTTVLAAQHEASFRTRFAQFPVRIESLSRFKSAAEQKKILGEVKTGSVDIVIGTHRLLSNDVTFKKLGLIVVDEEHRFGVQHKEKLKAMRVKTHVLTLTATPIPRTLHMSLSGIRDITVMTTPPSDRLPIKTYVAHRDTGIIRSAIDQELHRGGQVFFLHNHVKSIYKVAEEVQRLFPQAQVAVAHGQLPEQELESVMVDFFSGKTQVLICTTIIESGLDVPRANTLLVDRADALGLAQLYQLRGRVGRGQERAFAYLMIPEHGSISADAKKRLDVIQRFVELGSGFQIASHDLEIRGGGNLLGPQQSGHIEAIGFDLYYELLNEAIQALQGRETEEDSAPEPEIKVPFASYLDEKFIPDPQQRMILYRRLGACSTDEEILGVESELHDRFGALPSEAQNLLWVIRLKRLMKSFRLDSLTVGPDRVTIQGNPHSTIDPTKALAAVAADPRKIQFSGDSRLVLLLKPWSAPSELYVELEGRLETLR